MVHPIIVGVIWVNRIFSINHVGTLGLALGGDRCRLVWICPFKVFTFKTRQ
jgi:hypothetical protein